MAELHHRSEFATLNKMRLFLSKTSCIAPVCVCETTEEADRRIYRYFHYRQRILPTLLYAPYQRDIDRLLLHEERRTEI